MSFKNNSIIRIFFSSLLLVVSQSYEFFNTEWDMPRKCSLSLSKINNRTQTIMLDIENNTDTTLKDCIIKALSPDQSIVVIKDTISNSIMNSKFLFLSKNANIMFTTEVITVNLLDHPVLTFVLKSHWSLVYIVVSSIDSLYKCDQGKFNEDVYTRIEFFLNALWHKYQMINVVVAFPFVCPHLLVIYDGKKQSNVDLYDRTIQTIGNDNYEDMSAAVHRNIKHLTQGYPLRANIFYRFPTSINECTGIMFYVNNRKFNITRGFCGLDGLVMYDVMEHFKFKLSAPILNKSASVHGYLRPDGVVTGSLGYVVRNEIDISFNSRFMVPYTEHGFHFLHYVEQDSLCAVMKRPEVVPLWHYPYNAYNINLWLLILSTLIILGFLMWMSAILIRNINGEKISKLRTYVLDAITTGFFGFSITKKAMLFVLRGTCLYMSIILSATYQGHVNYEFTTLVRYDKMNKLEDIYKTETAIYTSPSIKYLLEPSSNSLQKTILGHVYLWPGTNDSSFDFVLRNKNTATLERRSDVMLETLKYYTDERGIPLLYVIDECFRTFYLSYIVTHDFLFTEIIQIFMVRLIEAGLPKMYYQWTGRSLGLPEPSPLPSSEPRQTSKIALHEQSIAFVLLFTGYVVSIIVFFVERQWVKRDTKRRDP